jgi:hypothetical protein
MSLQQPASVNGPSMAFSTSSGSNAGASVVPGMPTCYSLNIMVGMDGSPEVLLRIGKSCDTSIGGATLRFKLTSPYQIESFIQSFKALAMIQDVHMKCTTDLTNPSCFPLFHGKK